MRYYHLLCIILSLCLSQTSICLAYSNTKPKPNGVKQCGSAFAKTHEFSDAISCVTKAYLSNDMSNADTGKSFCKVGLAGLALSTGITGLEVALPTTVGGSIILPVTAATQAAVASTAVVAATTATTAGTVATATATTAITTFTQYAILSTYVFTGGVAIGTLGVALLGTAAVSGMFWNVACPSNKDEMDGIVDEILSDLMGFATQALIEISIESFRKEVIDIINQKSPV
jgi:hypothetical protein